MDVATRVKIEDVLRRYCRGVDRGDADLIRSAYHVDATDDHGTFKGSGHDFADHLVAVTRDRWLASQHQLHQTNLAIDGSTAWVETYFTAIPRLPGKTSKSRLETFGGRYVDRFEGREGVWAIAHRRVVYDWSRVEEFAAEYPHADFDVGTRDRTDPSYHRT